MARTAIRARGLVVSAVGEPSEGAHAPPARAIRHTRPHAECRDTKTGAERIVPISMRELASRCALLEDGSTNALARHFRHVWASALASLWYEPHCSLLVPLVVRR